MIENKILFRDEFKKWLVESQNFKPTSADSYLSYVSGANKQFLVNDTTLSESIEKYYKLGKPFEINNVIITVINSLYSDTICEITGRPQNTINNWRSGLLQYIEFFYDITEDSDIEEFETKKIVLNFRNEDTIIPISETNNFVYSVGDLMKNFKFRMITQDRFYGDIFFPISFIKRLLFQNGNEEYFNHWLESQINNITIFSNDGIYKFSDISELIIKTLHNSAEVYVSIKNIEKPIFTQNSKGEKLIPFASPSLKTIAIDHLNPIKLILSDNIEKLSQLQLITSYLKEIVGSKSVAKKYKNASTELLKSEKSKTINIEMLKEELDFIKNCTNLQLMDKIENIKKGVK